MSKRSEHLYGAPGVRHIQDEVRCDGIRWGEVPLKALFRHGPNDENPPTGTEQYRCKNNAKYRYIACEPVDDDWDERATSGNYCYSHLVNELYYHIPDRARFERYLDEYPLPEDA